MATKKFSELTVLDTVNANLVLTVIPVYDTSSGTTRKVTLQQINDSIEANIPFAAAAFTQANTPSQVANSASSYANASFLKANTATTDAANADSKAVSSGVYANAAFGVANTATTDAANADSKAVSSGVYANAAFIKANTATTDVANADSKAVSAGVYANAAFAAANTGGAGTDSWARDTANSASSYANSAYSVANTANTNAVTADQKAVTSGAYANAAYGQANTSNTLAQQSYDAANTKVSKSGDTMTGDLKFGGGGGIFNMPTNQIAITANVDNDVSGFFAQATGISTVYANTDVTIQANTGGAVTSVWTFNSTGSLTLPREGKIYGVGDGVAAGDRLGYISWSGNTSGDGLGFNTMRLVPDQQGLEDADQYIILDPTSPGHIHIRAGGTQDDSGAELFLGGENSHVKVGAGLNPPVTITSNSYSWTFDVNGELTVPGKIYFDNGIESVLTLDQFGIRANTQLSLSAENYVTGNNSTILFDKNGSGITFRLEDNTPVSKNWIFNQNNLVFPNSSTQTGAAISIVELKALVANCATYGDFQTAIANL